VTCSRQQTHAHKMVHRMQVVTTSHRSHASNNGVLPSDGPTFTLTCTPVQWAPMRPKSASFFGHCRNVHRVRRTAEGARVPDNAACRGLPPGPADAPTTPAADAVPAEGASNARAARMARASACSSALLTSAPAATPPTLARAGAGFDSSATKSASVSSSLSFARAPVPAEPLAAAAAAAAVTVADVPTGTALEAAEPAPSTGRPLWSSTSGMPHARDTIRIGLLPGCATVAPAPAPAPAPVLVPAAPAPADV
jgi:hypothetical protein